jgi:hypothetical protein
MTSQRRKVVERRETRNPPPPRITDLLLLAALPPRKTKRFPRIRVTRKARTLRKRGNLAQLAAIRKDRFLT